MYIFTKWLDRATQYVNRYKKTDNADGTVTLDKVPGEVLQEGTPQNAAHFNALEMGVLENSLLLAEALRITHEQQRQTAALEGETGEVVLTNSGKYPYNNSLQTVALAQKRTTTGYTVEARVKSVVMPGSGVTTQNDPAGVAGHLIVTDKLLNGFKIQYTGSAASVTVEWIVRGGMERG